MSERAMPFTLGAVACTCGLRCSALSSIGEMLGISVSHCVTAQAFG